MTRNAKVFACWYQSQHKGADVMPQDIINYKWIPWNPWMIGSDQCDGLAPTSVWKKKYMFVDYAEWCKRSRFTRNMICGCISQCMWENYIFYMQNPWYEFLEPVSSILLEQNTMCKRSRFTRNMISGCISQCMWEAKNYMFYMRNLWYEFEEPVSCILLEQNTMAQLLWKSYRTMSAIVHREGCLCFVYTYFQLFLKPLQLTRYLYLCSSIN